MISRGNITKYKMIQNKLECKHAYFYIITIQTYYYLMGNSRLGSHFCSRNISFWWLTSKQSNSSQTMFHVIIYDSCHSEAVLRISCLETFDNAF